VPILFIDWPEVSRRSATAEGLRPVGEKYPDVGARRLRPLLHPLVLVSHECVHELAPSMDGTAEHAVRTRWRITGTSRPRRNEIGHHRIIDIGEFCRARHRVI
jgi:hypothetical protein